MRAPSRKHSSTSTTSSIASGPATGRRRAGAPRLTPQLRLVMAVMALAVFTYAAMTQSPRTDAYLQPSVFSRDWWGYPFEWNSPARLPAVGRDLKDVHAVPDTNTVYAVGERGTILVSTDNGRSWRTVGDRAPTPPPPPPTPQGTASVAASSSDDPERLAADIERLERQAERNPADEGTRLELARAYVRSGNALRVAGQFYAALMQYQRALLLDSAYNEARDGAAALLPLTAGADAGGQGPASSPTPARPADAGANVAPRIPTGQSGPASIGGKTLVGIFFYNEREGFVTTESDNCISTGDGGVSWSYCDARELSPTDRYFEPLTRAVKYAGSSALPPFIWLTDRRSPTFFSVRAAATATDPAGAARKSSAEDSPNPRTMFGSNSVFFVFAYTGEELWLIVDKELFHSTDGGQSWEPSKSGIPDGSALRSIYFFDKSRGWAVGDRGVIVATGDGGKTWVQQGRGVTEQNLKGLSFRPDGLSVWVVGDGGTILHTEDGGATWVHQARAGGGAENAWGVNSYWMPAPWYYVGLGLVALLLLPVRRSALVDGGEEPEASVADVLVSDRPLEEGDPDTIDFKPIALGLSRFLRNENTRPPLTIAITGEWGTGKSSLMNLLRADLRRYDFRPVWFNAWHHQKEEHLLASLLQNVRLQAVPPFWRPEGLVFRLRLLRIRGARHWAPVLLLTVFVLVALFYGLLGGGGGNTYLAHWFKEVAAHFNGGVAPRVDEAAKPYLAFLPLLVSLVTGGVTLWRGATAFGVKPASLLASMSRGVRVRDLDAQTSFRQRFAAEFNDVTKALGARSMLVFIDDLDRCRPENVVETLEAVNFLVTSGECFVVIGMARERVEPCVGLSFRDVAAEMRDERAAGVRRQEEHDGRGPEDAGAQKPSPEEQEGLKRLQEEKARDKRFEYARQYLDKLINIEVPVPVPTARQSCDILLANAR